MAKATQSGKPIGILFPNPLHHALKKLAEEDGVSFPFTVRQACIRYLAFRGIDISDFQNPEGRGVRSDLARLSPVPESSRRPAKKQKGVG